MTGLNNLHILTSTTVVQSGVWHHVAVAYKNGIWQLYVDGVAQAQASGVYITQSTGSLAFGRKGEAIPSPGYFQGAIDEVMIFNRALSGSEIQAIYAVESNGVCKTIQITSISRTGGSTIQHLTAKGPVADDYQIHGSTNLLDWDLLSTLANSEGRFSFWDRTVTNFGQRFFRVMIP